MATIYIGWWSTETELTRHPLWRPSRRKRVDPRELWKALQTVEDETGARVMAIAHNGNLSNGMMFPSTTVDGEKITAATPKPSAVGADL